MHILFLDESGTPPHPAKRRDKYFVIGGLAIPDTVWKSAHDALHGMKTRRKINGELKWRYFAGANDDAANPMRTLNQQQRNDIRAEMYQIICGIKSIKAMACVACIEEAYKSEFTNHPDDLYHNTYKPVSERFQYYLQDLSRQVGRTETGIIVADHRGAQADSRFRTAHENLVRPNALSTSDYKNLERVS